MKVSEIKNKFLKWNPPFMVGKTVKVPVFRRVSKTHDYRNPSYQKSWAVGEARVTSLFFMKTKSRFYFCFTLTHNPVASKWVDQIRALSCHIVDRDDEVQAVQAHRLVTTNDDLFTPAWAQKLCDRLNATAAKKGKKIKAPKTELKIKAKPCKCGKTCSCQKEKKKK